MITKHGDRKAKAIAFAKAFEHIPDQDMRIFGLPLWRQISRKTALGRLRKVYRDAEWLLFLLKHFKDATRGTLINECSGLNSRILEIDYAYRLNVLWDVDFTTDKTGCSLLHCGIEPAKSKAELDAYRSELIAHSKTDGDPWGFVERYEKIEIFEDGTDSRPVGNDPAQFPNAYNDRTHPDY